MLSDAEIAALDDVMYPRNLDDTKFEQERPAMARRVGGRSAPARVFVSHTSELADFPAGRSFVQAVLDAVARVGMAPVDMRYFAAREGQPAPYCRRRVRGCDIYVALVGFRYGSLVPGEAIAYTEVEFLEATVAGYPDWCSCSTSHPSCQPSWSIPPAPRSTPSGSGYSTPI